MPARSRGRVPWRVGAAPRPSASVPPANGRLPHMELAELEPSGPVIAGAARRVTRADARRSFDSGGRARLDQQAVWDRAARRGASRYVPVTAVSTRRCVELPSPRLTPIGEPEGGVGGDGAPNAAAAARIRYSSTSRSPSRYARNAGIERVVTAPARVRVLPRLLARAGAAVPRRASRRTLRDPRRRGRRDLRNRRASVGRHEHDVRRTRVPRARGCP